MLLSYQFLSLIISRDFNMATTRKKVKVIGTETYIKQDTGEIAEMQVVKIEERDANFHKLWLGHILQSIDLIGNQKTKLAFGF